MYTIAKRFHFSAAHQLKSPALSADENAAVYGKCANPAGHGHDYTIEVIVSSPVLSDGLVVHRQWLDDLAQSELEKRFMFKNLNVTFGDGFIPTGEKLAEAAWQLLCPHLPIGASLAVRLVETPKNAFVFRGNREQLGTRTV